MIKLELSRTAINNDGTKMYLSDVSVWGAPNSERSSKALLIQPVLQASSSSVDIDVTPYDPETIEHFELLTTDDGYIEVFVGAFDKVIPSVEGNYGWDSSLGLVKMVNGAVIPTTVEVAFNDPLFLDSSSFKTVLLARLAIYKNTQNLELVRLRRANFEDKGHARVIADAQENFNFINCLLNGARYQWCMDNYYEAQSIVESFSEIIKNDE